MEQTVRCTIDGKTYNVMVNLWLIYVHQKKMFRKEQVNGLCLRLARESLGLFNPSSSNSSHKEEESPACQTECKPTIEIASFLKVK